MKLSNKNQSGFTVVEVALILVVVGIVGFVGYRIIKKSPTSQSANSAVPASQVSLPSKIQSKADVSKSIKALNATPIDNKLDPSQLDNDMSSLL